MSSKTVVRFERDLENKTVTATIDTSESMGDDALDRKYGHLAMGYAAKIADEKTLEILEHVPDKGTSVVLESYPYSGEKLKDSETREGAMSICVKLVNDTAVEYIGGAKVPTVVMASTIYTMLSEAVDQVSSHVFVGEDEEEDEWDDEEDFLSGFR